MPYQLTRPFASREIIVPKKSNRELNIAPHLLSWWCRLPPCSAMEVACAPLYRSAPLGSADRGGSPFSC